jgi:ribosomal protein S18 acetylase RimI-like enzyme
MTIVITPADWASLPQLYRVDGRFCVNERLCLAVADGRIRHTFVPVEPPYEKIYPPEDKDYTQYIGRPDRAIYFAYLDDRLAGQIILSQWWNGYGYIEDIAVDVGFRRGGVGAALLEQAAAWAQALGLPGLMLETQDINAAACRLYARCGFELAGFDRLLYSAIDAADPARPEIALYWYRRFPSAVE